MWLLSQIPLVQLGKWQNQKSGWRLRKIQLNPGHSWKKICQRFGPWTKIEKSSGDFWGHKGTAQPLGLEILHLRILNFSQSHFAICNHQYIFGRTLSGCCFGRFGYGWACFCLTYHWLMPPFNVRFTRKRGGVSRKSTGGHETKDR